MTPKPAYLRLLLVFAAACGADPTLYLGAAPQAQGGSGSAPPTQDADMQGVATSPPQTAPMRSDAGPTTAVMAMDDASAQEDDDDLDSDEDDDDVPAAGENPLCSLDADCASTSARPYCQAERMRCVTCLEDRHCPEDERCDSDDGECDDSDDDP